MSLSDAQNASLYQANEAVSQGNLGRLHQCLQSLLGKPREQFSPEQLDQMLVLALQGLEQGDFQTRWDFAKLLPSLGRQAIAPLLVRLEPGYSPSNADGNANDDWEFDWFIVRILGEISHVDAIATLIQLLQQTHQEEIGQAAAAALAKIANESPTALSQVLDALNPLILHTVTDDSSAQLALQNKRSRRRAIQTLAQISSPIVGDRLRSVICDPDPTLRALVLEALVANPDHQAVPLFQRSLQDTSAKVRRIAVTGLGLHAQRLLADSTITPNFDPIIQQIASLLWDVNLSVCQQAAIALGRCHTPNAALAMLPLVQSPHTPASLTIEVIRVLGWMNRPEAMDVLASLLEFLHQTLERSPAQSIPTLEIARELVTVLGRVSPALLRGGATQLLINFWNSRSPLLNDTALKQQLALSLGHLHHADALDCLIDLLDDAEPSVQFHAIAALRHWNPSNLTHDLLSRLETGTLTPEQKQRLKQHLLAGTTSGQIFMP